MPDALQERVIQKTSSHVNDNLRKLAGSSNKSSSLPLAKGLPSQQKIFHSELCMVSFLLGIFSFIMPLFSPLAIIFGIGGLMQKHRENLKGGWMAIFGIVLGFLSMILIIIAIYMGITLVQEQLSAFGNNPVEEILKSFNGAR